MAAAPMLSGPAQAYSFQTHQQLVDLTWNGSIVPLLVSRFPQITVAQLQEAHAYAYGGSAIQDVGYYPLGNGFFSDLTHYVRAGDFVESLLRNAHTPDELAFAVGALSHYVGDVNGHSEAVNPAVAIEFPKLRARYGSIVTYEQNPHAHVRTEFAFDIDETTKRRFAPLKYLDHIGLNVSTDLLARAFYETYGLRLDKTLRVQKTTLSGYRFSVRRLLPRVAYAETVLHRHSFPPEIENDTLAELKADVAKASAENGWESFRRKPGIGTYSLAGLIYVLPKIGPLSSLAIKGPTSATEQSYVKSVIRSTAILRAQLLRLRQPPGSDRSDLPSESGPPPRQRAIPNRDLDTGQRVSPGSYRLTDETYAMLLKALTKDPARKIPVGLKEDLLGYYADPASPIATKQSPAKWAQVQAQLAVLNTMATAPHP